MLNDIDIFSSQCCFSVPCIRSLMKINIDPGIQVYSQCWWFKSFQTSGSECIVGELKNLKQLILSLKDKKLEDEDIVSI